MKYSVEDRLIWLNGQLLSVKDAKICVLSPTAQFGLNVFEGIPCYWNEKDNQLYAFRLKDHYKRLLNSAKLLEIDVPYSVEQMEEAFKEIIKANDFRENISVRQTLFVEGVGSWGDESPCGMFVAPIPRRNTSAEYNKKGLRCMVSTWQRISEKDMSPKIKCGANYINSRMGHREARRNGYDTCLFLGENGCVSEGAGSCFFMVKDGVLITPRLEDSVLESITRDTVIRIAKDLGIQCQERSINKSEVYLSDEAFLCGSAMEVTPVTQIDGTVINYGLEGKITAKIHACYIDIVKGENKKYIDMLTATY